MTKDGLMRETSDREAVATGVACPDDFIKLVANQVGCVKKKTLDELLVTFFSFPALALFDFFCVLTCFV